MHTFYTHYFQQELFRLGEIFHDPALDLTRQDIVPLRRWIIEKLAIRKTASPQPVPSPLHSTRTGSFQSKKPSVRTYAIHSTQSNEMKQKNEQPTEEGNSQDIVPAHPETSLPTRVSRLVRTRTLKSKQILTFASHNVVSEARDLLL